MSSPRRPQWRLASRYAAFTLGCGALTPFASSAQELPSVSATGQSLASTGATDAASEGTVTAKQIQSRAQLRTAEVMELIPGMIVSQHSGDGKANQYYLRGFNLDHGTDFATWVDGMPVNMSTHSHGQGYTDLNFLIPELLQAIHYRKGLYAAEDGDFSATGSARMSLANSLSTGIASVTVGEHQYLRSLIANSTALKTGQLLYAVEGAHNNGPWDTPENYRRFNGVLRYSLSQGGTQQSLTAMAYTSQWQSTNQVPQRAIDSQLVSRYGAIDPTDHGRSDRYSLSWQAVTALDDGEWRANAYAIQSSLDLFSNVTYYLDDPVHGDQIEQAESRRIYGGGLSRTWQTPFAGLDANTTIGSQFRQDRLNPVGLYTAESGVRSGTTQESRVHQTGIGLYGQQEIRWNAWLRSIVGMRVDQSSMDVRSNITANSGHRTAWISSPKFALIATLHPSTEVFLNAEEGFHSNDARGVTARVSARSGDAIDPAMPLVRAQGSEIGIRSTWLPGLQTSLTLWQLRLASELIFVGDAGETEASGASHRYGMELNNHYAATTWLTFDANFALSQARFDQAQGEAPNAGRYVPGAVKSVGSVGATVSDRGPWFGQFQVRYFGPRALIEDNSVRSHGTTLAYARVGYKLRPDMKLSLDVFNLFNRKVSDIDYYYTSRLSGEAAEGVSDVHTHPAEPRTARLTLTMNF